MGDYLIVALSTDKFNKLKGKKAYYNYRERKEFLESIRYVDLVIPESSWGQKIKDIKDYKINIFVMGSDWRGKFDDLGCIYMPRTKEISTTKIKKDHAI